MKTWEMDHHRDGWWWLFEAIGWARQTIVTIAERWAPGEDVAGEEEA